jgi:Zn-dependent protease
LFGFPVRITPWFWVVAVLLCGNQRDAAGILVSVLAVLVSIVIHELGHSWAFRYFGLSSHIVLYHFGGLAVPETFGNSWGRPSLDPKQSAMISAAGPLLQILAGVAVVVAVAFSGYGMVGSLGIVESLIPVPDGAPLPSPELNQFVSVFCWVSVYWAIFNLLPVLPLDGGQITRDLLIAGGARDAISISLMVSMCAAGAMFLYGMQQRSPYICLLFFSLGYSSFMALNQYGGGGGFRPRGF